MRYDCIVAFEHKFTQMKDTNTVCLVYGIHAYGLLYSIQNLFSQRSSSVSVPLLWSLFCSFVTFWCSCAFIRDARDFIFSL